MRLYFPSAHRADNVAQLFKKEMAYPVRSGINHI